MNRLVILLSCLALAQADWDAYLKSITPRTFDWIKACKALNLTPSGYGMSMGGGVTKFHLKCSNEDITVKCDSHVCSSDFKPPATAADTPPTGKYSQKVGSKCSHGKFSEKDAQMILDYTNKMRCVAGAPPVAWDSDLECQAQDEQDKIGGFKHAKSYDLPIPSGENLATGTNPANAAYMWFTEFLSSTDYQGMCCGHFSAMDWRSVTKMGCGMQSDGGGVIRCEYAGADNNVKQAPNYGDKSSWDKNIPTFKPSKEDFAKCSLPVGDVVSNAKLFMGWGILNVNSDIGGRIGLYSDDLGKVWYVNYSTAALSACIFAGVVVMGVVLAIRRRRAGSVAAVPQDEEQLLEGGAPPAE